MVKSAGVCEVKSVWMCGCGGAGPGAIAAGRPDICSS